MRYTAVDKYFKTNRRFIEDEAYPNMTALYAALDREEYDIIYGIDDSEFSFTLSKSTYNKMKANPDKITILYECKCKHPKKHRHHPNYNDPLTVILLCPSCHKQEHARLGRWYDENELLVVPATDNSNTPAVNAPAEDRGALNASHLDSSTSPASEYEIQSHDIHQACYTDTGCFEPKGQISEIQI